ncbi:General transcription factor IIF subunit 2 [Orchesella cincta]|uniref:General transcription factor IIF subunit 2 n=1 Tax=Orchesella cincta TaxID=48709 RepID=A0A1D2NJG4_ORCCI|nr:General transcription factor IIF subunit 2 [Orchesella cincta]
MSQVAASSSSQGSGAPGPSTASSSQSGHSSSKVDLSLVNRGIWLVKVPKYLAERWARIPGNVEAGKLKIYKSNSGGGKPKVTLSLSEATICAKEAGDDDIPKEHDLIATAVTNQTMVAFDVESGAQDEDPEKLSVLGKVHQKLECRPVYDTNYMQLKKTAIHKASQPTRQVKQLDRVVQSYKPVSDHKNNKEYEERKKAEGKKARDDKEKVLEMLFSAFEKHQYYNVKDLVRITNQPVGYLKEVLKEVCNYCVKNPHKNMWELKPEYRHYKMETDD